MRSGCGSAIGVWAVAALLGLAGGPAQPALRAQAALAPAYEQASQAARQEAGRSARLTVNVPQDDTVLSWKAASSWAREHPGRRDAAARTA